MLGEEELQPAGAAEKGVRSATTAPRRLDAAGLGAGLTAGLAAGLAVAAASDEVGGMGAVVIASSGFSGRARPDR